MGQRTRNDIRTASNRLFSGAALPALLLSVLAAVLRLVFVRSTPANWDAVQFALGVQHFDLHLHQPHPPGYVLYMALGAALNLVFDQPAVALSLLTDLSSATAVGLLYFLTSGVYRSRSAAVSAALLLAASPLAIYYGATGLSYAPELCLSIAVACAAWQQRQVPTLRGAVLLALLLALAGGVRQTTLLLLLPLCIWALWRSSRSHWAAFAGVLLAGCLVWFVPLLVLSGGLQAYVTESRLEAESVTSLTQAVLGSEWDSVLYNLRIEAAALATGLVLAVGPLFLLALKPVRAVLPPGLWGFAAAWVLPGLLSMAVTHVGQFGYLLFVVPPFLMVAAGCVEAGWAWLLGHGRVREGSLAVCLLLSLVSLVFFLAAPGTIGAQAIVGNDERWHAMEAQTAGMDPAHTILVMNSAWAGPFREAGYLLPQFHSYASTTSPARRWAGPTRHMAGYLPMRCPGPRLNPL